MITPLFPFWRDCPICEARESVEVKPGPANFFRCQVCHQAIKQTTGGKLVPWLDVHRAGRKGRRRKPNST